MERFWDNSFNLSEEINNRLGCVYPSSLPALNPLSNYEF